MAAAERETEKFSIVAGLQAYILAMVDRHRVSGLKVLIVDAETVYIMSLVLSMSKVLEQEICRVVRIDTEESEKMLHMKAICFLRPTKQNYLRLAELMRDPSYCEYHVFFSNAVQHHHLERLACCDEKECVHQVQEFYADVYAINHDLFSLNLPSTIRLSEDHSRWTEYELSIFDRIIEGLMSAILCLQVLPTIRYSCSSPIAVSIAHKLQTRIIAELSLFELVKKPQKGGPNPVVLLLDRRNDPVTPLLNQWTYQAMLHEILTIENNRVDLSKVQDIPKAMQDVVVSTVEDPFFAEHFLSNYYPTLVETVQSGVEEYKREKNDSSKLDSIEDMQRFVSQYPELRQKESNVFKHVELVRELKRHVELGGLFESSLLEQGIACSQNRQEHFDELMDLLRGQKITNWQGLRLVMLYALRYEDARTVKQLRAELRRRGITPEQVSLVDKLLDYSGSHVRSGDLFDNKTALAKVTSALAGGLGDLLKGGNKTALEALTQHKSYVGTSAELLVRGRLADDQYPFVEGASYATPSREAPPFAIVFVIGGTTFEEARDVTRLNRSLSERRVVLGGTTVHNTKSFLAEVAQVGTFDGVG